MLQKINIVNQRFDELNDLIIQPDIISDQKKYVQLKDNITIVRYSDCVKFTDEISSICDARLIWGGDKSIKVNKKF